MRIVYKFGSLNILELFGHLIGQDRNLLSVWLSLIYCLIKIHLYSVNNPVCCRADQGGHAHTAQTLILWVRILLYILQRASVCLLLLSCMLWDLTSEEFNEISTDRI